MNRFSLKSKIMMFAVLMSVIAASVGISSYLFNKKTLATYDIVLKHDVPAIRALNRMLLSFRMARIELLHILLPEASPEDRTKSLAIIEESWKAFEADRALFLAQKFSDEETALYKEFEKQISLSREIFNKVTAKIADNKNLDQSERHALAELVMIELGRKVGLQVKAATRALIDYQAKKMEHDDKIAQDNVQLGNLMSFIFTAFGTILGLVLAFVFSNLVTNKIRIIIDNITQYTASVKRSSEEIDETSGKLSSAVSEQAASLQETVSALHEISSMITKTSESAETTGNQAKGSQDTAMAGKTAVDEMSVSMNQINDGNNQVLKQLEVNSVQMNNIVNVINEIEQKTKVINEIVFQTKLLSFNASVEAARAGEHGKGFSVVAEEVGNLARMSGQAAKEISELLQQSVSQVEKIVTESKNNMDQIIATGKERVRSGVEKAHQCGVSLEEIVQNVTKVAELSTEITSASKEQSLGVSEINKAMEQLDVVTQSNSAVSEQSAASAKILAEQAISLNKAVEDLAIVVMGGRPQIEEPPQAQIIQFKQKNRAA
jgi:methyl-accepting chemotaxis protein